MRSNTTEILGKPVIVTLKVEVKPDQFVAFADLQAKMNAGITSQPGFVSLEFLSPSAAVKDWLILQRFSDQQHFLSWRSSSTYQGILSGLEKITVSGRVEEMSADESSINQGIAEVIVAEVYPEKVHEYREWISRIHQLEANYPGFRGVYIQSPVERQGKFWITLLQFDTIQNLDRWLGSSERQKLLEESKSMISYLETHRVISPYAGWFASLAKEGPLPALWKQTMIVLLVLFPIVMLQFKYLMPLLKGLDSSLATFIANAISVSLISFPGTPIVIYFLSWWLTPKPETRKLMIVGGTFLVIALYLLEIWLFWSFV